MKIFLLNAPPLRKLGVVGQIYPPLGILYLSAYAKSRLSGLDIRAVDGYRVAEQEIIDNIVEFKPDILGVSFTTQAATGAYKIIGRIKEISPSTLVVCGGPHPTVLPQEVLTLSKADIVVLGEGEEIFLEIIKKNGERDELVGINGTAARAGGEIKINPLRPLIADLDSIPFPDRGLLDIRKYPGYHYKKRPFDTSIISARGCPYNCVYCSNPVWKLQKPWYRLRSPENVVDEMEYLKRKYNINEFYDETDEFNGSLQWAKDVCDEVIRRKLNIHWKVQMRADNVDEELARKMKQSGCWLAFFGIETGNDRTSKGIHKNITREQVIRTLTVFKYNGIKTFGLLMAFNVWEENGKLVYEGMEETKRTLEFAKYLIKKGLLDLMSWSLTTPYPGSKLYDIAVQQGLIDRDLLGKWDFFDSSANFVMRLPGVSAKDWSYIQKEGKKLQAWLLFKSGTFNWRSIPVYLNKLQLLLRKR